MSSTLLLITGIPSSGKTTLARALQEELRKFGVCSIHLDGMDIRRLTSNYRFDERGMEENVEALRVFLEVMKEKDVLIVCSAVLPRRHQRDVLRRTMESILVYLDCPLEFAMARDDKGVYEKAKRGEMYLPGFSQPYEDPSDADLILDCRSELEDKVRAVIDFLREKGWV